VLVACCLWPLGLPLLHLCFHSSLLLLVMPSSNAALCALQIATYGEIGADAVAAQLLPAFCDDSAHLYVHLARCLAAHEMLARRDAYERFLPGLEGLEAALAVHPSSHPSPAGNAGDGGDGGAQPAGAGVGAGVPTIEGVVDALVLRDGVDAEHPMMQALAALLGVPLAVVYTGGAAKVRVRPRALRATCTGRSALLHIV
jgi:hypothetical protein